MTVESRMNMSTGDPIEKRDKEQKDHFIWDNVDILKSIVKFSPMSIVMLDLHGKVLMLNHSAEAMFGWKETEIVNKPYPIFYEEGGQSPLLSMIKEEIIDNKEAVFKRRSGLFIDINYSSIHLYNNDGVFVGILATLKDISKRKKAELELKQSLKKLEDIKFALDQSSIIAITDPRGIIRYVNDKFCEISKYSRQELLGQNHRIVNAGYHSKAFFAEMWKTISAGKVWSDEVKNRAKDGSTYWVQTTIVPFLNENGKPYQYVSIRTDISERKKAEEKIKYLAYYDELTSLPNRRLFKERLVEELEKAKSSKEQIAVLCLGLDRFRLVNDTFGHRYGDLLLKEVANRLKEVLRPGDVIARYGGDEFFIYLKNVDTELIKVIAKNCIKSMEMAFRIDRKEHVTTCSIGISVFPHDGETFEDLVQKADIAINRVKDHGKNNFQFFETEMDSAISRELLIERNLRSALKLGEFEVYYQPKMELSSLKVFGMEALLRWNNCELGFVSPAEFIPIAEETGLIIPIGEWVLKTACVQIKRWEQEYQIPISVSVNLSVRQFQEESLVERIKQILQETNLNPACLELEITENIAVHEKEYVTKKLQAIQRLGVNISMDDFGKGYSSLSYLKDYPINTLKIDKSFIDEIFLTGDSPIVRAIIAMSHSLNLSVVAEGVETKEQLEFLQKHKCNSIQGFIISKPVNANQFERQFLA